MIIYRKLSPKEVTQLQQNGCSTADWNAIEVAQEGFNTQRISNVTFCGSVKIGACESSISIAKGVEKPTGIRNATITNCTIGNEVLIENIGGYIANYSIEDGCYISNANQLSVKGECSFGNNGVRVSVMCENGGREVTIFDNLS